jgi:zinc transporter ZupT
MSALLLSLATFFSTLLGGPFGLRYRNHLNLIMGFTAGVLVGLVSFDLLPEIFRLVYTLHLDSTGPMLALMGGFLTFHNSIRVTRPAGLLGDGRNRVSLPCA